MEPQMRPYTQLTEGPNTLGLRVLAERFGKYEGMTYVGYLMHAFECQPDEEIGDVQEHGWFGKFDGAILPHIGRMIREMRQYLKHEYPPMLTDSEREYLKKQVAAIVKEDNYGFVYITFYDNRDEFVRDWREIEEMYLEDSEEEE